jgi:hypothetical protein
MSAIGGRPTGYACIDNTRAATLNGPVNLIGPMTWIVCKAEETDYSLPFKRAPSSASQDGRSTFSSGKSVFFGLGPTA